MFYYIINTTYQKIGDLFCPVHISGLSHSVWPYCVDPDFLTKITWSKILPKLEQDLIQIFIWIKWGQRRNKIWINEHGHEFTVHEKLRNFKCVQCGAAFSQKTHLRIHIQNVHEKVKHFVCHLCGKGFADKSRLQNDVYTRHSEPASCDMFIKTKLKTWIRHRNLTESPNCCLFWSILWNM